jgi:hypothetical protein
LSAEISSDLTAATAESEGEHPPVERQTERRSDREREPGEQGDQAALRPEGEQRTDRAAERSEHELSVISWRTSRPRPPPATGEPRSGVAVPKRGRSRFATLPQAIRRTMPTIPSSRRGGDHPLAPAAGQGRLGHGQDFDAAPFVVVGEFAFQTRHDRTEVGARLGDRGPPASIVRSQKVASLPVEIGVSACLRRISWRSYTFLSGKCPKKRPSGNLLLRNEKRSSCKRHGKPSLD